LKRTPSTENNKIGVRAVNMREAVSVVVRPGTRDPDFDLDIGGWQGRIKAIDADDTVLIEWDSGTLERMGLDLMVKCEVSNLDWRKTTLLKPEVVETSPRDSEEDVEKTTRRFTKKVMRDRRVRKAEP